MFELKLLGIQISVIVINIIYSDGDQHTFFWADFGFGCFLTMLVLWIPDPYKLA